MDSQQAKARSVMYSTERNVRIRFLVDHLVLAREVRRCCVVHLRLRLGMIFLDGHHLELYIVEVERTSRWVLGCEMG
jgi:hypothetical protein